MYVQNVPVVPTFPQPVIQHSDDGPKVSVLLGSFTGATASENWSFFLSFTRAMSFW